MKSISFSICYNFTGTTNLRETANMTHTKSQTAEGIGVKPHLEEIGESYFQHMGFAFSFSRRMIGAGFCCFIHALFPNTFRKTGSSCIAVLYDEMVVNRHLLKYRK